VDLLGALDTEGHIDTLGAELDEREAVLLAENEAELDAESDLELLAENEAELDAESDLELLAEKEAELDAESDIELDGV